MSRDSRAAPSRAQQAFQDLLSDDFRIDLDDGASHSSRKAQRQADTRQSRRGGQARAPGFQFRKDSLATGTAQHALQDVPQLLLDMFAPPLDRQLVADVYQSAACSVEAATEALLGMAQQLNGARPPSAPAGRS